MLDVKSGDIDARDGFQLGAVVQRGNDLAGLLAGAGGLDSAVRADRGYRGVAAGPSDGAGVAVHTQFGGLVLALKVWGPMVLWFV